MKLYRLLTCTFSLVSILGSTCVAQAQDGPSPNVTTFATGLKFPRGLKFGPDGNLYVAEGGAGGTMSTTDSQCTQVTPPVGPYTAGFTARISRFTLDGTRTTVADNLPSTVAAVGDISGVADLAFIDDTLYALITGAGCSHGNAMADNSILRVNIDGTTTPVADLSTYLAHSTVANPSTDDFEPDGEWYSMLNARGTLYALEANRSELLTITPTGQVTRLVDFSATQGSIVFDAIAYDGDFYVGNLKGFPITDGASKVLKVTPDGQVTTFATGLTAVLSLAFDAAHRLYALETSTKDNDFPTPGTGKVVRLDPSGHLEEIATGLSLPTAMAFGPDGNLYVSNWGFGPPDMGEIVKVDVNETPVRLANVSSRGVVQTGDNVMIAGFILNHGSVSTNVVIRALGPSLGSANVQGTLSDPTLDLRDASGTRVAFDNDWQDDAAQATKIAASGLAPTNPRESALALTLAPGAYTAIVSGNKGATGVGLVEVYSVK